MKNSESTQFSTNFPKKVPNPAKMGMFTRDGISVDFQPISDIWLQPISNIRYFQLLSISRYPISDIRYFGLSRYPISDIYRYSNPIQMCAFILQVLLIFPFEPFYCVLGRNFEAFKSSTRELTILRQQKVENLNCENGLVSFFPKC